MKIGEIKRVDFFLRSGGNTPHDSKKEEKGEDARGQKRSSEKERMSSERTEQKKETGSLGTRCTAS